MQEVAGVRRGKVADSQGRGKAGGPGRREVEEGVGGGGRSRWGGGGVGGEGHALGRSLVILAGHEVALLARVAWAWQAAG